MGSRNSDTNNRNIATNKQARRLFAIEEKLVAGLALTGSEVKSLRGGMLNIGDGYIDYIDGELWLANVHIKAYPHANRNNHEPMRKRKLLLNKREIERVRQRLQEKGYSAVPIRFFIANGWVKLEIGLGKGKKLHDRRQDIKTRDAKRDMARALSE